MIRTTAVRDRLRSAAASKACAYVLVLLLASVSDDFDYSVISEEERVASVKCVPEVDDSVLTIPAAVGPFWRSYKVVGIESHAFENNESFARLELPDGLRSIGYGTFYGCRRLRSLSLPRSVEEIGDGAFYGCSSLSEVTLSPDMKSMGEYVFERCTGLRALPLRRVRFCRRDQNRRRSFIKHPIPRSAGRGIFFMSGR